ncbi:MAG: zinc ribbon domain-containing protein [Chloroflexi bacterium]|nr:zinc ribbon domain-containing protein [Chloroflexota bacterium]
MRKWFLILTMTVLLVFPSVVSAQGQIAIESVDVGLWPEYDKPDMLVINYIMLAGGTEFPVQVNIRIPAGSVLHTVAVGETPEAVTDQGIDFKTANDGDWLVVSIQAEAPAIQIEYYDPALKKDGEQRSYSFRWLSDYNVANFSVMFQQPFDAEQFTSSLSLQDDGLHADELQYYFSNVGAIPAGETLAFDLNYQKPTDVLSVSRLQLQPVAVDENTAGRVSLNNYLPYIIGTLGVIMIVGGFMYYRQSGLSVSSKKSRRKRADRDEAESGVYCAQCGTRARSGDRFCRTCGSRIRQPEE